MNNEERNKIANEFHRLLNEDALPHYPYIDHQGDEVILDGWFTLEGLETIVEIWKKSK